RGVPRNKARAEARLRFGDPAHWHQEALTESATRERNQRRRSLVVGLREDLRTARHRAVRRPASAIVVLVIMTVGLASGAAIWAVMDAVLFRPLPFPESNRVVAITGSTERSPFHWLSEFTYEALREGQRSFTAMAATRQGTVTLLEPFPDAVGGLRVESTFFDVVGVGAALGRLLTPDDDAPDAPPVAVLTHDLWRDRFGGDPDIVGQELRLDTGVATVVGVTPEGFGWRVGEFDEVRPEGPERKIFLNGVFDGGGVEVQAFGWIAPLARLAEGATVASADADMDRIMGGLVETHPDAYAGLQSGWGPASAHVQSVRDQLVWLVAEEIWLLAPAAGLLLLLVSLNAGSLIVVGLLDRRAELAVRASLGASRWRLARQILLETGLRWAAALIFGLAVARAVIPVIGRLMPRQIPFVDMIQLGPRTVVGAVIVAGLLWMTSSVLPLAFGARIDLLSVVKSGAWSGTRRRARAQQALIAAQVALSCGLVGGAGLLIRSYARLLDVPAGASGEDVVAMEIRPPSDLFIRPTVSVADVGGPRPDSPWMTADEQLYGTGDRLDTFVRELLDRVGEVPGVERVAFANLPPFYSSLLWHAVLAPGQSYDTPREERVYARVKWVSPGYFGTVGLPILRGRGLERPDNADSAPVMVVNEAFVERFLPDVEDPLGQGLTLEISPYLPNVSRTVVGIVPNVLHYGPHDPAEPVMYIPVSQVPPHWASDQVGWTRRMWILARLDDDSGAVTLALREAIWSLLPEVPIRNEATLVSMKDDLTRQARFFTALLGSLALIALILAVAGLAATLGQQVRHRTREYGLRKAIGAGVPDVLSRTLLHGARLALLGIVPGTVLAWLLARLMADRVVGVGGFSTATQTAVALILLLSCLLASLAPALRAARVDPVISLKAD
ncbi:MAG: ABC transporter permease, partial [Longimicrobiales bacterium]|nr:ABC transporter permease [Longimicrobiales bacterium]